MKDFFTALRPKQWVKNTFIFLPLLFGKKIFLYPDNLKVFWAFCLFSAVSSAVYLINDVMDIKSDREHPVKRLRPIAAGKVSAASALILASVIAVVSVALSFTLDPRLAGMITFYLIFNLLYSCFLKHKVIIDVLCIGVFFLLRLGAGSVVANIQLSHWIIFMTALLALFLGFNKRRQELHQHAHQAVSQRRVLEQYDEYFIDQMVGVITASVVVVYMLYTVDQETVANFGSRHLIYTIPFVYYGVFRYLYLVHKAEVDGDPTKTLLLDRRMQINVVLWVATCVGVIYFGL